MIARQSTSVSRNVRSRRVSQVRLLEGLESRVMLTVTGVIEVANPGTISGYAYDPAAPDTAVTAYLQIDGSVYTSSGDLVTANGARPDITFPTSDNNHGFSHTTPTVLFGAHTVNLVEVDPNNTQVVTQVIATANFTNNAPTGVIQSNTGTNITGYAYDPDQPTASLTVLLRIDGTVVQNSTQVASIDQPALTATIGSSAHGFSIAVPTLAPGSHKIEVFAFDPQTGVSALITSPNPPVPTTSTLSFGTEPATTNLNTTLAPIVVNLKDANGAVVTTDNSTVTLSIASGPAGGTILGTATANAVNGVATFSGLSFATAGNYTLTATDGSLGATSTAFTINQNVVVAPAPDPTSSRLLIKGQPTKSTTTNVLSPITVQVLNSKKKLVATDESAVTLKIVSGSGVLSGTTAVAAVNGVATFSNLTITGVGKFVLQASDAGLIVGKSKTITVAALPVVALRIAQQPTNVAANGTMSPALTVQLLDKNGTVVTTAKGTVKLGISSSPAGAKLAGNTAPVKGGAATFSKLKIKTPGTYVLTVTDGGLTALTTASFVVA